MASLTVRSLDDRLVRLLQIRAAENGRSAEAEHREILRQALEGDHTAPDRSDLVKHLTALQNELGNRPFNSAADLQETRQERLRQLTGSEEKS